MFNDAWNKFILESEDDVVDEGREGFLSRTASIKLSGDRNTYDKDFSKERMEAGLNIKRAWRKEADLDFFMNDVVYVHYCSFYQAKQLLISQNRTSDISTSMFLKNGEEGASVYDYIDTNINDNFVAVVLRGTPSLASSDMDSIYSGNYRTKCPYNPDDPRCLKIQKFPVKFDSKIAQSYILDDQDFNDSLQLGTGSSEALLYNWVPEAIIFSQENSLEEGDFNDIALANMPDLFSLSKLCKKADMQAYIVNEDLELVMIDERMLEFMEQELAGDEWEDLEPRQVEDDLYGSIESGAPATQGDKLEEQLVLNIDNFLTEGKKDACYHKVRSRYKKWPSAYASGALVKCRKVGAKNWGNSIKEYKQKIPGGLTSKIKGNMKDAHKAIADKHDISLKDVEKQIKKGLKVELEHTTDTGIAHEIAMDHVWEDPKYYDKLSTIEETKKKAGTESSKEKNLRDWFKRKGAKGKTGGWVDCNTCRDGKCKPCGRQEGESRAKYPACRPTPSACKEKGRGKTWGKKSKKIGK